jgi:cbb3-type cytochrome oxidase subunit 3
LFFLDFSAGIFFVYRPDRRKMNRTGLRPIKCRDSSTDKIQAEGRAPRRPII